MSSVISLRVSDEVVADIERLGYRPSDFARRALDAHIRRETARQALERLRGMMVDGKGEPVETLIRRDRDSR